MIPKGVLPQKRLLLSGVRPKKVPPQPIKVKSSPKKINFENLSEEQLNDLASLSLGEPNACIKIENSTLIIQKDNKVVRLELNEVQLAMASVLFLE